VGEIKEHGSALAYFQRGISDYPAIGNPSPPSALASCGWCSTSAALRDRYRAPAAGQHDRRLFDVNEMLSKHFAVLGTTGVGKSSGVVLILQR